VIPVRWLWFALPVALAADPAPQAVMKGQDAPTYAIAGGKGSAQLLLNASTGSKEAALSVLVLAPGVEVPAHRHEGAAEMLYVEEGAVEMTIGGVKHTAVAGDAIYVPPGVEHSARVTTKLTPLRAVQVYVGPGPEQRFASGERVPNE
jgi:putative monooxygenase